MQGDREKQLVLVLRKIPVFDGLLPFQIKRIVGVCKHRSYQPGDTICYVDTPSTAMYVLISGELSIISSQNARVATILPVTTVGEMGVLTGQPRSATVEVSKPSAILTIQKVQFDAIMDDDVHIQVKVYQNIVKALSDKLGNDNLRLRDLQLEIESAQERLGHLRSGYKKAQQRTDDAFSLAASYGDMQRDKFETEHSDTLQEHMPRLLIVDGDVNCCALLQDALGQFEVIVASNGNEAVGILDNQQIDMVVIEICLMDMDGEELLQLIRQRFPGMGVIGIAEYMEVDEAAQEVFDGFVEKPIDLLEFQRITAEVIGLDG